MLIHSFRTTDLSMETLQRLVHPELLSLAGQPHANVTMLGLEVVDDNVYHLTAIFGDDVQVSYALESEADVEHFKAVFGFWAAAMNRFHKEDGTYLIPMASIETAADMLIPLLKTTHKLVTRISDTAMFTDGADIVGYRVMNHVINHTGPNKELVQLREVLVPTSLQFGTTGHQDFDYWFPFLIVADEICFCGIVGSPVLIKALPEDDRNYQPRWTGRTFWLPTGDATIVYEGDNAVGKFEYEGDINRFVLTDTGAIPIHAPYLGYVENQNAPVDEPESVAE